MEKSPQMNNETLEISAETICETIRLLRAAGRRECVLLWLGQREDGVQRIIDVFKPTQESYIDYFEIPRAGMVELMDRLRSKSLYVASQVHTHPGAAFHSPTDDRWAIVRHVGALSVVIPRFARTTTPANFLQQAAVYQLNPANRWIAIPDDNLSDWIRITP
jgi:proteasome lid subunit RPN8/RPN11